MVVRVIRSYHGIDATGMKSIPYLYDVRWIFAGNLTAFEDKYQSFIFIFLVEGTFNTGFPQVMEYRC